MSPSFIPEMWKHLDIIALLTKSVQELSLTVEKQNEKIKNLEERLIKLENK